jgi:hypothetical protein
MKTIPAPPEKLSDLIELALGDLEKVEKDERYRVDMEAWHTPLNGKCRVCLAGSVIAQTFLTPVDKYTLGTRSEVGQEWSDAFDALNAVRLNDRSAIRAAGYKCSPPKKIRSYKRNPKLFKSDLRQLISDLREVGE